MNRYAGAVAAGLALDRVLREPPDRWHPVAAFGSLMGHVERALWADRRTPGGAYALVGLAVGAAAGRALQSVLGAWGGTAVALTGCVAGTELRRVAGRVADLLEAGDLEAARAELPRLVGRDPSALDVHGVSAAVVESLAENAVDAVVAPVCWALLLGAPGAAAHRAVNTTDSVVGHRSDRYARFGTAAARLDDVAAWVPARAYAVLLAACRPSAAAGVARAVRRDAPAHPSPNAGVAEAAMAAALGVELGGPLRYGDREEDRPRLGRGPRPGPQDVRAALELADRVERLLLALLVIAAAAGRAPHDA